MTEKKIKLFDVVDDTALPEISFDREPEEGDPIEINGEMYYVCEKKFKQNEGLQEIGVIPLVVKNPGNVENIKGYINCLALAHRRVQYKKGGKDCTLDECDEMIIL